MKNILIIFAIFISALRLTAQTNAPIRLALVSETAEMFVAADVLTAELSGHKNLQLLERNEIEKVYREQGLSAGNKDYLKLGQVLGADGLLLMETAKEGTNQYLNLRLVAVKPGVVLVAERFSWPLENLTEWSATFAKHLGLFLPKLTVSRKDAIPVSVVNLRSAISSADAVETERQLKLLLIQRLSREKELFVLERQKMQLLSGEKELKLDDSAFWNGSYLLEGVVDQNGYSQETITVNGRLTPPKEGTLLSFAVSGSRTNLVEVVNQLAAKVNAALKVNSSVKEWNAADEAVQYFVEAQWALRWGAYAEAQAAADSAWVLGKQDLACALVRVKAYLGTPNAAVIAEEGEIDRSIIDSSDASDRQATIHRIRNIFATHSGAVFGFGIGGIDYVLIDNLPEERNLYYVSHALELYREFSQTLPTGEPKANSAWYVLGVESLTAAAQILQRYYLVPKSQGNVADKLSELRASSRQVAGWISRSPSVHDSYFAANPDRDKERRTLMDNANIYSCKLNWGCFWQEKPEDCVALYNELLKSSAFSYFTEEVGGSPAQISKFRGLERPFLVAWNEADRKRVQIVWEIFVRNLNDSPDFFLQKQAVNFKGIEMPAGLNAEEIISQYEEYWPDIQAAKKNVLPTEKQGQSEASDLTSDVNDFISTEATRSQALAIKPRLMAYQNNLVQEMPSKSGAARHNLMMAVKAIDRGLLQVESILNRASLEVGGGEAVSSKPAEVVPKTVTNILRVVNYLGIPQKDFPKDEKFLEEDKTWGLRIVGSRWVAGKLVMDLRYHCEMHINGSGGDVTKAVAAIFDPVNESWKMLEYPPEFDGTGYPQWPYDAVSFEIYHDDFIFSDGGQIQKYDFTNKQWENFQVLGLHNSKLFVVEGHLYAANNESIFEIAENGKGTHILASTRRRPAVSALDSLSGLGSPVLFSGLDHALCASLGNENFGRPQNKSYSWDGHDWHEMFNLKTARAAEVFEDAVIFRFSPWDTLNSPSMVWLWDKHQVAPDLALYDPPKIFPPSQPGAKSTTPAMSPLWRSMENYSLANASMTYFKSNLFLYVDQASAKQVPNGGSVLERGGCDADLICLDRNYPEPIVVPLKYDLDRGPLPWSGFPAALSPVWMSFTSDFLLIGNNTVPGVWVIPIAEIGAAVATQKQALLAKKH